MGDQLRLHVDLRFRVRLGRLDSVRLQHGVRRAMVSIPRQAGTCDIGFIYHRPGNYSGGGCGHAGPHLSDGDADFLPVRVRRHHRYHPRGLRAWSHELHGMDDLLSGVDDAGLYRRRI